MKPKDFEVTSKVKKRIINVEMKEEIEFEGMESKVRETKKML